MSDCDDALRCLEAHGWFVLPRWLDEVSVRALAIEARAAYAQGDFAPARVGARNAATLAPALRADSIRWLDEADAGPAARALLAAFEHLRVEVNRHLQLGLFDLEAHFALYPPGAGYGRHVDRFRDDDARVLSVVLYLNEAWQVDDGGALRMETSADTHSDVLPEGGTLVGFLSDRFPHEVLPARRERLSVAGWFKRRR